MAKIWIGTIKEGKIVYEPTVQANQNDYCKTHEGKKVRTEVLESLRTDVQNRALHLWFTQVATELDNAGWSVQEVLKEAMEIDWNPGLVKEILWRTAQEKILHKKSTTDLKKQEDIDKVYDHLCRHLGQKFFIEVPPFPHYEDKDEAIML
jgi:hypothetical protein